MVSGGLGFDPYLHTNQVYYDLCTTLKLMWLSFQSAETWSFDYYKVKSCAGLSITRKEEERILSLPREDN